MGSRDGQANSPRAGKLPLGTKGSSLSLCNTPRAKRLWARGPVADRQRGFGRSTHPASTTRLSMLTIRNMAILRCGVHSRTPSVPRRPQHIAASGHTGMAPPAAPPDHPSVMPPRDTPTVAARPERPSGTDLSMSCGDNGFGGIGGAGRDSQAMARELLHVKRYVRERLERCSPERATGGSTGNRR